MAELKQWKLPETVLSNKQIPYKEELKQWKLLDGVIPKKHIRKNSNNGNSLIELFKINKSHNLENAQSL